MEGGKLRDYGIGQFQAVMGSLPLQKQMNWKSIGNSFSSFYYFKNGNDMGKFLKRDPGALQESPPDVVVHNQNNTWHDQSTWTDTYTQVHPWELNELDFYYGKEYRASVNNFPTPKDFYSASLVRFVNWFHPDPKKFFVANSNENEQKQRLIEAFMATKKRFQRFLKPPLHDSNNIFLRHMTEMNINDPEDRERIEDILLQFHFLGLHIPGFWIFFKTPSSKVVLYNPKFDHYFGFIKGHSFPMNSVFDKSQFFYINAITYHTLWRLEKLPKSAKPQIRPGPQSKAQMPSFTDTSPEQHHAGQSRAEREMISKGAMVSVRMKHYSILPFTIEFGQPIPPYTDSTPLYDGTYNVRLERWPLPINMDNVELIPQKTTSQSLMSRKPPPPRNSYRPKLIFHTHDGKKIAAYTQPGITYQYGQVHKLETLPREPPVDIRVSNIERHSTFLTTEGYLVKYLSSVAVNNPSAEMQPDLLFCDIPNMLETEPPVDPYHVMVQETERTSLNSTAQQNERADFNNGNFGGDTQDRTFVQVQGHRPAYAVQTTASNGNYRVVHPINRTQRVVPMTRGTVVMSNRVQRIRVIGGQPRVPNPHGAPTYRTRTIVRYVLPDQPDRTQPIHRAPIEFNTMMRNGPPQPRRQYTAAPVRQAQALVQAAQQRVIPRTANVSRNFQPQTYIQAPVRYQPVQEQTTSNRGNEASFASEMFFQQQVGKEVVVNEEGIQIEERDMPILDREDGLPNDMTYSGWDYDEPTTSSRYEHMDQGHSYYGNVQDGNSKLLKARSQTAPPPRERVRPENGDGNPSIEKADAGTSNQTHLAGPSRTKSTEPRMRPKQKEIPVVEERPHLNKPTRTRFNGRAVSLQELPPLTKPRHPNGPRPVNVSTMSLASHIPQAKELIAAMAKRGPGRPKNIPTSRGVEGQNQKKVIIAMLQTQQPEVLPPNLNLPEEEARALVPRGEQIITKIFNATETKPAKRRKAKARVVLAPRKSKGRRRPYVKQDVKVQKEIDLAVVEVVLDLLNNFGDIPDPEIDLQSIPLSKKSINIKKGMRPYMERRRLLWRLRCDGPSDSLTAPKTRTAKTAARESSVTTNTLENLLNLDETQLTETGHDRSIVELLDTMVDLVDARKGPLNNGEAVIQQEEVIQQPEEEVMEENTPVVEEDDLNAQVPEYYDEADAFANPPDYEHAEDSFAEAESAVENVSDNVTTDVEVVFDSNVFDLPSKSTIEPETATVLESFDDSAGTKALGGGLSVEAAEEKMDESYDKVIAMEPIASEEAKMSDEVHLEVQLAIDFICSKLDEREPPSLPVVEQVATTEENAKLGQQSLREKSIELQSKLVEETYQEKNTAVLEAHDQEPLHETAWTSEEPVLAGSEIASLVEKLVSDVSTVSEICADVQPKLVVEKDQEEVTILEAHEEAPSHFNEAVWTREEPIAEYAEIASLVEELVVDVSTATAVARPSDLVVSSPVLAAVTENATFETVTTVDQETESTSEQAEKPNVHYNEAAWISEELENEVEKDAVDAEYLVSDVSTAYQDSIQPTSSGVSSELGNKPMHEAEMVAAVTEKAIFEKVTPQDQEVESTSEQAEKPNNLQETAWISAKLEDANEVDALATEYLVSDVPSAYEEIIQPSSHGVSSELGNEHLHEAGTTVDIFENVTTDQGSEQADNSNLLDSGKVEENLANEDLVALSQTALSADTQIQMLKTFTEEMAVTSPLNIGDFMEFKDAEEDIPAAITEEQPKSATELLMIPSCSKYSPEDMDVSVVLYTRMDEDPPSEIAQSFLRGVDDEGSLEYDEVFSPSVNTLLTSTDSSYSIEQAKTIPEEVPLDFNTEDQDLQAQDELSVNVSGLITLTDYPYDSEQEKNIPEDSPLNLDSEDQDRQAQDEPSIDVNVLLTPTDFPCNSEQEKNIPEDFLLDLDTEDQDQANRIRTTSEASVISEDTVLKRDQLPFKAESPAAPIASPEQSPAVEEIFAKIVPEDAELGAEFFSEAPVAIQSTDDYDESCARLLETGPRAPLRFPFHEIPEVDLNASATEPIVMETPVAVLLDDKKTIGPYSKEATVLNPNNPRFSEQNNIHPNPHLNVRQGTVQPPPPRSYPQPSHHYGHYAHYQLNQHTQQYLGMIQSPYSYDPTYSTNQWQPMSALHMNNNPAYMVRSHHPHLTQQPAWSGYQHVQYAEQSFPPINNVFPNNCQQELIGHSMPGVPPFSGGYQLPVQQHTYNPFIPPQPQQGPAHPMMNYQRPSPYPVHQPLTPAVRRQRQQQQYSSATTSRSQRASHQQGQVQYPEVVLDIYNLKNSVPPFDSSNYLHCPEPQQPAPVQHFQPQPQPQQLPVQPLQQLPTKKQRLVDMEIDDYRLIVAEEKEKKTQPPHPVVCTAPPLPIPAQYKELSEDKTKRVFKKANVFGVSNHKPLTVDLKDLLSGKVTPIQTMEKAKRIKNAPAAYPRDACDSVMDKRLYESMSRAVLTLINENRKRLKTAKQKIEFMKPIWNAHLAAHVVRHIQATLPNTNATITMQHYEMSTSELRAGLESALKQLKTFEKTNTLPPMPEKTNQEPSFINNALFLSNLLAKASATKIQHSYSAKVLYEPTEPTNFYEKHPNCKEICSLRDYLKLYLNTVPDEGLGYGSAEVGSPRCVFMVFTCNSPDGTVLGSYNFVMTYGELLKGGVATQAIKIGPFRPIRQNPKADYIVNLSVNGVESNVQLDASNEECCLLYYSGLHNPKDKSQYATFLCGKPNFKPYGNHEELLENLGMNLKFLGTTRIPEKQPPSEKEIAKYARETSVTRENAAIGTPLASPVQRNYIGYPCPGRRLHQSNADLFYIVELERMTEQLMQQYTSHMNGVVASCQGRIQPNKMKAFALGQTVYVSLYKATGVHLLSNCFLPLFSPSNIIRQPRETYQAMKRNFLTIFTAFQTEIMNLFNTEDQESCYKAIETDIEKKELSAREELILVAETAWYQMSKTPVPDKIFCSMEKSHEMLAVEFKKQSQYLRPVWNCSERKDTVAEKTVDLGINFPGVDKDIDEEFRTADPEKRKEKMIAAVAKAISKEGNINEEQVKMEIINEWNQHFKLGIDAADHNIRKVLPRLSPHTQQAILCWFSFSRQLNWEVSSAQEICSITEQANKLCRRIGSVIAISRPIKEQIVFKSEPGSFSINIRQFAPPSSASDSTDDDENFDYPDDGHNDKKTDENDEQPKKRGEKRKENDDDQGGPPMKLRNGPNNYNYKVHSNVEVNFALPSLPSFSNAELWSSLRRNYAESVHSTDSGFDSLPSIEPTTSRDVNDDMSTLQAAIDLLETASVYSIDSGLSLPILDDAETLVGTRTENPCLTEKVVESMQAEVLVESTVNAKTDIVPELQPTITAIEEQLRVDTTAPLKLPSKSGTPQIMSPSSISSSDSGSRDGRKRGQSYLLFDSLYGVLREDVNNSAQSSRCTSEEIDVVGGKKESPRLDTLNRFIVPSTSLVAKRISPLASKRPSQSLESAPRPAKQMTETVRREELVSEFHQDIVPNVKEEVHFHYTKRYVIQKDFNAKTATIVVSKRKGRGKRSELPPSAKAEIINRLFNEGKNVLPLIFDGNSLALATMEEVWNKAHLPSTSGLQTSDRISSMEQTGLRRPLERIIPTNAERVPAKKMRQSFESADSLLLSGSSRPFIVTKAALKEIPYRNLGSEEPIETQSLCHEDKLEDRAEKAIVSELLSSISDSDSDLDKGLVIDTGTEDDEGVESEDEQEPFVILDEPPSPIESPTHLQLKEVSRRLLIDIPFPTTTPTFKLCTKAKSAGHSPIGYLFAEKMSLKHRFAQFRIDGKMTSLNDRLKENDHCANGKLLRKFVQVAEKELHRHRVSDQCDVFVRKSGSYRKRSKSTDRFFPRPLEKQFGDVWDVAQDSLHFEEHGSPLLSPAHDSSWCSTPSSSFISTKGSPVPDLRFPGYEQLLDSFIAKSTDGLLYFRSLDLDHSYFPYTYTALMSQPFMQNPPKGPGFI